MYEIKTEEFSGPLDKLLELIESKKLDITTISLAQVTDDFIKYIETLKNNISENQDDSDIFKNSRQLADFLVVASGLILIKSKSLLPQLELTLEEEESVFELEKRIQIYAQIKPLFALMKKHWLSTNQTYSRGLLLSMPTVFYPPKNIDGFLLNKSLEGLIKTLGSYFYEQEKIQRQLFSLEEKISEISKKIINGISKFSQMIGQKSKGESIVLFLALLHLLRDRVLDVNQIGTFEEMEITKL